MQLGAIGESTRAEEIACRLRGHGPDEVFLLVRPNRHEHLVELPNEEVALAGNALVKPAVVQNEREVSRRLVDDAAPALGKHHTDSIAPLRLQEHVAELFADDFTRIENGAAGIRRRELTGLDGRQLYIFLCAEADLLDA